MINYVNCREVALDVIYEGFKIGFSDYMIKLEMTKEIFLKRFFGPEGNQLEHSFIALEGEKPIGLVLGGVKNYEGLKTLRCGALCIDPNYRGKGVSQELFQFHRQIALDLDCKQLFLEVIVGNDRAINFYRNLNYEKVYDIKYYSLDDLESLKMEGNRSLEVKEVTFKTIRKKSNRVKDIHVNWQNDFDYMEKTDDLIHYGIYKDQELISALSIHSKGKIFFLWTEDEYRNRGMGKKLINKAVEELNLERLTVSFPNNASLEGFFRKLNFRKDEIAQYEMYSIL